MSSEHMHRPAARPAGMKELSTIVPSIGFERGCFINCTGSMHPQTW